MTQFIQHRTAKVLVLGDAGVGKSSLIHILCHNDILHGAAPTIGCNVDVRLHTSFTRSSSTPPSVPSISNLASANRSSDTGSQPSFVEFYDISGSPSVRHPKSRNMFYTGQYQGIILVHDICNKRSHDNLWKWMKDYLDVAQTGNGVSRGHLGSGGTGIPVFVVGNKKDLASGYDQPHLRQAGDDIAREYGGEAISVSSNSLEDFLPSSHTFMALNLFFDSLLDPHQPSKSRHRQHPSSEAYPSNHGTQTSVPHAPPSNTEELTSPTIPIVDFATFTGSTTSSYGYPSSSGTVTRSNTPYSTAATPPSSSQPLSSPHHNSVRAQYERNRSILGQYTSKFLVNPK